MLNLSLNPSSQKLGEWLVAGGLLLMASETDKLYSTLLEMLSCLYIQLTFLKENTTNFLHINSHIVA